MKIGPNILVVGSINIDLVLQTERIPERGESYYGKTYSYIPGGKGANQAVAASRLGGNVTFFGKIGNDSHGSKLRTTLQNENIDTTFLLTSDTSKTGLAVILLEPTGANRIIVYAEANSELDVDELKKAFHQKKGKTYNAVIMNLEIPDSIIKTVIKEASQKNIPVILDTGPSRKIDRSIIQNLFILSPNETELHTLTDLPCSTMSEIKTASRALYDQTNSEMVVVKMGEKGALLFDGNSFKHFPAQKVKPVDTTAAGDCFTAALAVHYLQHTSLSSAISFANKAAAISVTRLGAQPSLPYQNEIS